jgi:hypothetical protein
MIFRKKQKKKKIMEKEMTFSCDPLKKFGTLHDIWWSREFASGGNVTNFLFTTLGSQIVAGTYNSLISL